MATPHREPRSFTTAQYETERPKAFAITIDEDRRRSFIPSRLVAEARNLATESHHRLEVAVADDRADEAKREPERGGA
jgi:hypothetical protein